MADADRHLRIDGTRIRSLLPITRKGVRYFPERYVAAAVRAVDLPWPASAHKLMGLGYSDVLVRSILGWHRPWPPPTAQGGTE